MKTKKAPDLVALIVTHLNVPYGPIVRRETVEAMLKSGSLKGLECGAFELSLLKSLFVECEPPVIGRACYQVGASLDEAQSLYTELRAEGHPVVRRWERAVCDIVIPYEDHCAEGGVKVGR